MRVTKVVRFDAAHHLPLYEGKCRNLHGHTWKLEVTIEGPIGEDGFVIDFKELKETIDNVVDINLDHRYLNDHLKNPTCENVLQWIWNRLSLLVEQPRCLVMLRLWESETSYATLAVTAEETVIIRGS